jgi:hypothetical protein
VVEIQKEESLGSERPVEPRNAPVPWNESNEPLPDCSGFQVPESQIFTSYVVRRSYTQCDADLFFLSWIESESWDCLRLIRFDGNPTAGGE